ncbi:MAG: MerR family transcriptional regulator [Actinobacteria bacterium]|nr:MerR family transcriptional regulator [Actinomycetota bacterium]
MSDLGSTPDTTAQRQRDIARDAAAIKAGEQGLLFDESAMDSLPEVGYRGPIAAGVVGITYRQLDYWARTSLVLPTVRPATGSGTSRLYGFRDILELKIVKRLLDTGVSLQQIRTAVEHLRARGTTDLTQVTLMSDGVSVYECTSPDEVIDLLAGGQGVFGIAIGRVWQEIEGSLSQLPSDQSEYAVTDSDISETGTQGNDELSMRRRARVAGE